MRPNGVLSFVLLLQRAGPPSELAPQGQEETAQDTGRHLATACVDVLAGSVQMFQLGHVDAVWFRLGLTWGSRGSTVRLLQLSHVETDVAKTVLSLRWIVLELGSESWSYPVPISESGMGSLRAMTQTSHVLFPF